MNKFEFDEKDVIGFDALYDSMRKCKNGVMWKDSTAAFVLRGIERVLKLHKELYIDTYKPNKVKRFLVYRPKKREIASISFRDRVYQRSLNDNIVYPLMTNSFIYDNFACQKGKGTDAARNRLKEFFRSYYRKYNNIGYIAQFDIHGYYPNMDHEIAEAVFRKKLPIWAQNRVVDILRHQYKGKKGYNPGSQLIQIAGISVLDEMDHFIKEKLHVKYYIRYMDDFIIIHNDKNYLKGCVNKIKEYLKEIGFQTNPNKTKIFEIEKGVMFLGFKYYLTHTGKVLMFIDGKKVKEVRRKLKKLVRKSLNGGILKEYVDNSFNAWINHASKGDCYKLINRMQKYYSNLWNNQGG